MDVVVVALEVSVILGLACLEALVVNGVGESG